MYRNGGRQAFSPARHKRQRIPWKYMDDKGSLDALLLRCGKDPQWISSRGDQSFTLDCDPLVRVCGAVLFDPLPFLRSITGWNQPNSIVVLQSVGKPQHFFLLRRRKAADLIQDGFFETHAAPLLILPELTVANLARHEPATRAQPENRHRPQTPVRRVPTMAPLSRWRQAHVRCVC